MNARDTTGIQNIKTSMKWCFARLCEKMFLYSLLLPLAYCWWLIIAVYWIDRDICVHTLCSYTFNFPQNLVFINKVDCSFILGWLYSYHHPITPSSGQKCLLWWITSHPAPAPHLLFNTAIYCYTPHVYRVLGCDCDPLCCDTSTSVVD